MLTLLSPAKKMNMDPAETDVPKTRPRFEADTRELAKLAKTKTPADLKALMHISDNLANLNAERFQAFNLDGKSNSAKSAGLAFDGDVYWGLEAKTLSDDDLEYAQDRVRILSGLYGILRPMDLIQPYRLEMGTKFENDRGKNLYAFWKDTLAPSLNAELAEHEDGTIVNLASNEYFKAANTKALNAPIISAKFMEEKDGKSRPIQYYTKFGRGLMTRWIVQNRVDRAEGLKDFDLEGYKFDPKRSDADTLIFARPQPPKKS
ncbi:peroxide stress protein YaaA [Litorimonas sp. WD9-15]|uniref:peroxide stress protein YaaA n=1 Tax=Litorimonas sp. WD9-15 TaxID=3418716 RepID=UPI003CFDED1F